MVIFFINFYFNYEYTIMILRHFKASDYEPNNDLDYASFTDYHFARLFVHMLKKESFGLHVHN